MSVIRVNKTKDYVVMSNHHFKERKMSLKAKGLLSEMLSLPDDWDYSISGLVSINKENETSIKSALNELKEFGYLKVNKLLPNETHTGRIEYVYDIFEKKQEGEKQGVENLGVEFLGVENQGQYNINNKILNNKINNIFIKPTLQEVKDYCKERNNGIDAQKFIDFYESKGWMVGKNKMKDWKACVRTWERKNNYITYTPKIPNWFSEEQDIQLMTKQDEQLMSSILDEIGE